MSGKMVNHIDQERMAVYQKKMENPSSLVFGNMVMGGMIGAFFGYVSGAAYGVLKWNSACQTHPMY